MRRYRVNNNDFISLFADEGGVEYNGTIDHDFDKTDVNRDLLLSLSESSNATKHLFNFK